MTAINQRNLTAFHEAGHCVVAAWNGFALSVDIKPHGDRLGLCMARTSSYDRASRAYMMFHAAGPIAELIRRARGFAGLFGVHKAVEDHGLIGLLRRMAAATLPNSTPTSTGSTPPTGKPSSRGLLRTRRRC